MPAPTANPAGRLSHEWSTRPFPLRSKAALFGCTLTGSRRNAGCDKPGARKVRRYRLPGSTSDTARELESSSRRAEPGRAEGHPENYRIPSGLRVPQRARGFPSRTHIPQASGSSAGAGRDCEKSRNHFVGSPNSNELFPPVSVQGGVEPRLQRPSLGRFNKGRNLALRRPVGPFEFHQQSFTPGAGALRDTFQRAQSIPSSTGTKAHPSGTAAGNLERTQGVRREILERGCPEESRGLVRRAGLRTSGRIICRLPRARSPSCPRPRLLRLAISGLRMRLAVPAQPEVLAELGNNGRAASGSRPRVWAGSPCKAHTSRSRGTDTWTLEQGTIDDALPTLRKPRARVGSWRKGEVRQEELGRSKPGAQTD
jgi:hypothetical protein